MNLAKLKSAIVAAQQSINDAQYEHGCGPSIGAHPDNAFVDLVDAVQCTLHGFEYLVEVVEKRALEILAEKESPPIYAAKPLPGRTLAQIEAGAIRDALEQHGGNIRNAAKELGVARSTLQRKMDELGLRGKQQPDELEAADA